MRRGIGMLLGTACCALVLGCGSLKNPRLAAEPARPTVAQPSSAPAAQSRPGESGSRSVEPVLLEVPEDPTVTFKVWFRVGSHLDPAGKQGLAYVTGQMIADAATQRNSLDEILRKLYPLAADYEVSVDREMTVVSGRTHRDNVEAYFELLTDAILRPAFDPGDFERIKNDTLNHLKNTIRYQADEELGKAALYGFVFAGSSYAHPVEGTVQGVQRLTLDDVKRFYAEHYASDAVVGLGGGFDGRLVERFRRSISELPARKRVAKASAPATPRIDGLELLLVDKPGADASISIGFPIDVRRGDREFYALWLANSWLGEHRNSSSHLYKVIRGKRGMNYGDYSYIEAYPNGGRRSIPPVHVGREQQLFEIWIRTLPSTQAQFATRAAVRELKKLVDEGMTREEFELTRSFLKKYILHFADTTQMRLGYAVDDRFYGIGAPGHLAGFREILDELTLDEVNAAIRKHLQYESMKIAIVTGDAAGLRRAFVEDRPSPMTYESEKSAEILAEDREIAGFPLKIDAARVRVVPVDEIFEN